ncbi:MAG TPA: hypothetical protein VNW47_11710 [Terriglobales bacterium]|jgi:hypothetical protein|nr:hypothetical protein [Terriglobales bacterium]
MRLRTIALTVMVCLVAAVCLASGPQMGTWKLNEAKSKFPTAARNSKVVLEMAGDTIKVTIDGVDAAGKPAHNEWTGKFDGKDYPVTGDATSDVRSYKEVDAQTLEVSAKKGGKVTLSGKIVVSADGKTRTVTVSGTDSMGMKMDNLAVYDKQ